MIFPVLDYYEHIKVFPIDLTPAIVKNVTCQLFTQRKWIKIASRPITNIDMLHISKKIAMKIV